MYVYIEFWIAVEKIECLRFVINEKRKIKMENIFLILACSQIPALWNLQSWISKNQGTVGGSAKKIFSRFLHAIRGFDERYFTSEENCGQVPWSGSK